MDAPRPSDDAHTNDAHTGDAAHDDAGTRDAGTPSSACDPLGPIELGRSSTLFAPGDPEVVADANGWIATWALYEGVFASRPGSTPVRLFDDGSAIEALGTDDGVLVCAWPLDPAPAGRCVTLDGDLAPIDEPVDADYGTAVGFARLGGTLHAIERIAATITTPSTFALVPIDARGRRTGASTLLPCGSGLYGAPAWTDEVIACVVGASASCGTEPFCPLALRLVSPDGVVIAPDVAIPIAPPGREGHDVRVAAHDERFMVSWIAADGLHALPVSADGAAGAATHVGRITGPAYHEIVGIAAGYAVFHAGAYDRDEGSALGMILLSPEGHPIAAPASASSPPGGHGLPVSVASVGTAWAAAWLEREAGHAIYFRAFGCTTPGACAAELSPCEAVDGSLVCVDTDTERCDCGTCGIACDGACVDGVCVPCPSGTTTCSVGSCEAWGAPMDAACASLDSDPAHCGACDRACAMGQRCVLGECCASRESSCSSGGLDADCDGHTACDDCDCWASGACGFADPGEELDCANGSSEDFDGLVDCADPDCTAARSCGGPGRCPGTDLGTAFPLSQLTLFSRVDSDLTTSCGMAGQRETTLRWTAPATRRYSFVVGGSAWARAIVALRDGGCGGAEIACAEHEVSVDLAMGQSVVIVIEGVAGGCHELDIR